MSELFDSTVHALRNSLNLRQARQNVIASNIANADTPGYKAKRIEFEQKLREALQLEDQLAMQGVRPDHIRAKVDGNIVPEVFEDPNGVESLDGNTVNRNDEMARMSENQFLYNASVDMLKRKLGMMRYAITEGGGNK